MADTNEVKDQRIIPVDIESEMKKSFIDYAMSVIVDRALPDVRDGLKACSQKNTIFNVFSGIYTRQSP